MINRNNMLAVVSALVAFIASAAIVFGIAGEETNAFTDDGIIYEINEEEESATVVGYVDGITDALIPGTLHVGNKGYTVESVWYKVFYGCSTLVSLSCGTNVDNRAFANCTNLKTVELTDTAYIIGECAFYGCTSLRSVSIENSAVTIEYKAFAGCSGLEEIQFGGLERLEDNAFSGIKFYDGTSRLSATPQNLADRKFIGSESVLYLDVPEFKYNGVIYKPYNSTSATAVGLSEGYSRIDIGQEAYSKGKAYTVTGIADMAFYGMTDVQSVTLSFSGDIGFKAFARCTGIKDLAMGYVKGIGDYAFYGCAGLESVNIPATVATIGSNAFSGIKFYSPDQTAVMPQTAESLGGHSFTKTGGKLTCDMYDGYSFVSGKVRYIMESSEEACRFKAVGYEDGIENASIPSILACGGSLYPVSMVASKAFIGCSTLKSVTVGADIGPKAFANCPSLTSVVIIDPCTSIGGYAFYGCSGLSTVAFPSQTEIGTLAFSNCPAVTGMSFGGITSMGDNALKGITFYDGTKTLQKTAANLSHRNFTGKDSKLYLHIPDFEVDGVIYTPVSSAEAVASGYIIGIEVARIPSSVVYGEYADAQYILSVTGVSKRAFYGCSTLVSLSYYGTGEIGERAFANCTKLSRLSIGSPSDGSGPETIGTYAFYKCPVFYITLPDTVKTIKASAFSSFGPLVSASFPDSVTSIEANAFYGTKFYAADGETLLENDARSLSGHQFAKNDAGRLVCQVHEGDTFVSGGVVYEVSDLYAGEAIALTYTAGIKNAVIPSTIVYGGHQFSVKQVAKKAFFECDTLESLSVDTVILSKAFANCTSLKSVVMGDGCTMIYEYAFYGCSGLSTVKFPNDTSIRPQAFSGCPSITSLSFGHVLNVVQSAFNGVKFYDGNIPMTVNALKLSYRDFVGEGSVLYLSLPSFECDGVEYTPISSSRATVTGHADGIQSAEIPSQVKDTTHPAKGANKNIYNVMGIADKAFYKCESLTALSYAGTGDIGNRAFANCTSLTTVSLSGSLKSVGEYAFYKCPIDVLELPGTTKTIGASAFSSCNAFAVVDVPESVTSIGTNAFYGTRFYAIDGETPVSASVGSLSGNRFVQNDAGKLVGELFDGCVFVYDGVKYQVVETASGTVKAVGYADGVTDVYIPKTFEIEGTLCHVDSVKTRSFMGCETLKSVSIEVSVESKAFANCGSLESISIGPVALGDYAFYGCPHVKNAEFGKLESIGGNALNGFTFYDESGTKTLDKTAEELSDSVFSGTMSKKLIRSMSEGDEFTVGGLNYAVTSVNPYEAELIGGSFAGNTLKVPATVSSNGKTFSVTSIGDAAFMDDLRITTLDLNGSAVREIGISSFLGCNNLYMVLMDESQVETINIGAFSLCGTNVDTFIAYFPATLKTVGFQAMLFTPVTSLETNSDVTIDHPFDMAIYDFDETLISDVLPSGKYVAIAPYDALLRHARDGDEVAIDDMRYLVSDGSLTILECTTARNSLFIDSNTAVIISGDDFKVKGVAPGAFADDGYLEYLEIIGYEHDFVIGDEAFSGCSSLEEIYLDNVRSIGVRSFAGCTSLTYLEFGNCPVYSDSSSFDGIELYCNGQRIDTGDPDSLNNRIFDGENGKLYA